MEPLINPAAVFLPVLVVVALTFVAVAKMAAGRAAAVKAGQDPAFYRAHQGTPEPATTAAAVRHYNNLMELPTLFYAACLTAFALGAVGRWTLLFAWCYVVARVVQSAIHMTYNNPAHRGGAFMLGMLFVVLLWGNVAASVFALV